MAAVTPGPRTRARCALCPGPALPETGLCPELHIAGASREFTCVVSALGTGQALEEAWGRPSAPSASRAVCGAFLGPLMCLWDFSGPLPCHRGRASAGYASLPWRPQPSEDSVVSTLPPPANLDLGGNFGPYTSRQMDVGPGTPVPGAGGSRPSCPLAGHGDTLPKRPAQSSPAEIGEGTPGQVGRCPQGHVENSPREPKQECALGDPPGSWALREGQNILSEARCPH